MDDEEDSKPGDGETDEPHESENEDEETKPEEEEEEESVEAAAFKAVEKVYHRVVGEMQQVEGMSTFCREYMQLFDALFKSHYNEEQLMEKCRELEAEVAANNAKLTVAQKLSVSDMENIEHLKKEVETSWHMVDAAHAREQNAQETIENLREQVLRLTKEIEQKNRLEAEQSEEAGAANKNKEGQARERERVLQEVINLRDRLNNAVVFQGELERRNSAADTKINDLTNELEAQQTETAKELRFKERIEADIKELRAEVESKDQEIVQFHSQQMQSKRTISRLENSLKEQKVITERMQREIENLSIRSQKVQLEYDAQVVTLEKLMHENAEKSLEVKLKEEEIMRIRGDQGRSSKMGDSIMKKMQYIDNQRGELEIEKGKLQTTVVNLERDLDLTKKQADADKKSVESMSRDRDIMSKNLLKAAGQALEHVKLLRLQEQVKHHLEQEIDQYMSEASKQRKIISTLERERDRLIMESTELTEKVQEILDEVKLKQMAILDYKKKIAEAETKFRQQQNLFEAVRTDRNTFSKHLLEAQDEILELKLKLKVMTHQIEQLKEDITTKETQLLREEFALEKTEKEKENLKLELQQMKDDLNECKQQIANMYQEERKLQKMIQDADNERQQQKKEMEQIMNERDILGTQLVRRNDELSLLYEKIKILQGTLHKGEAQYGQRLEDIRLLKLEIKRLRQEKLLLSRSMTNMIDLRQEVFHLERDLTRERLKCRALEEELQNPLNVHRWRKLEGSDPSTFELIQKIHILQKRLLVHSSVAIERESQLRESERLYLSLRQLLARQPGPETAIRLHKTQQALRERGRKMRCLVSELNMYESQVSEYKFDLERVNQELHDVKRKYFIQKRRELKVKQHNQENKNEQLVLPQVNNSKTRFTGGGFNLNAQPTKTQSIGT